MVDLGQKGELNSSPFSFLNSFLKKKSDYIKI